MLHGQYRRTLTCVLSGDDAYLVRSAAGEYLRFDAPSWAIWEELEYAQSSEDLANRLSARFQVDAATCLGDVQGFLQQLLQLGLIEQVDANDPPRDRYLHLLKRALVNLLYVEDTLRIGALAKGDAPIGEALKPFLCDIATHLPKKFAAALLGRRLGLAAGLYSYSLPHTLIGLQRLEQLERYAEIIFRDDVPGDFLEAGVCRGGASIFLRALQVSFGQSHRALWIADSFEGLPKSTAIPDLAVDLSNTPELRASLEQVLDNFARYGLLDQQVRPLKGWFADTLPSAPVQQIALLRLDGDLYSSTMETLVALYHRVSPGGYVVVDDYGFFPMCQQAVDEFRASNQITAPLQHVDHYGVGWRKPF